MSRDDRILKKLATGRRLCDDCLSDIAEVKPRQSVYQACTALREQGILSRNTESCEGCNRMKITNAIMKAHGAGGSINPATPATSNIVLTEPDSANSSTIDRPWPWEGNVQKQIIKFLHESGISIHSHSNTASREQGKDIVAMDTDGKVLWISVKGFPENSPNTQARHWYAGALLDMALYRSQSEDSRLALGFPVGFKTYENLVRRTSATLKFLGCHIFWVAESGLVIRDSSISNT